MSVTEQLKEYCTCVEEPKEKDVEEIINLISMATCWTQKPCDTFLMGSRREVIDLPDCIDCGFVYKPFYTPFRAESFTFTVEAVSDDGITFTAVEDAVYSEVDGEFILDLPLPSCKCLPKNCGCPIKYKLIVEYEAGYEVLPNCLLPVFCNLLDVIQAKNKCDCTDCDSCGTEDPENSIKYASGDIVTAKLETDLGKILVEQYKRQLALISLCEDDHDIWGIVV